MGLAIVRSLTEAHGGTVEADGSGVGRGATSTVRLPIREVSPDRRHSPAPVGSDDITLTGVDALVVDDDRDARELLRMALERRGARVTAVGSAGEAVYELGRRRFGLLLADNGMPEQDGTP